ncbi:MAG TPA: D-cysteine desulfhydrase family protein [Melioribacteraceae bacterium]|nr:D-cysteine desulfhydrase family protein [Melioribacteraceae bacterium]
MKIKELPRTKLGFFPTPLHELKRITSYFNGPRIFIKRDDLTGLAFGGNKTRKLEYLIADAISNGFDTVITGGAEQSNHCRQTAAAAAASGLDCHLVLGGKDPEKPTGNILIDKLLGVKIHWTGEFRKGEKIPEIAEQLRIAGKRPYIIPYGGSNPIGVYGFIEAMNEIGSQMNDMNIHFDHIVFASSSGGTHAGIVLGNEIYKTGSNLIGIEIDKAEDEGPYIIRLLKLLNQTSEFTGLNKFFGKQELILKNEYLGDGYGVVGDLERKAIRLLAEKEGILVDPVYTGRTFGGLIDMLEKKIFSRNENILFWHSGGTPSLFADYII